MVVDVGLHAFEAFKGVVENAGGGVEGEVLVGNDVRGGPAGSRGPFYREHMVCRGVSGGVSVCMYACGRGRGGGGGVIYGVIYMGGLAVYGIWGCPGVRDKPEKVRPNTKSSGFGIVFGVCVLVIANLLASSSETRGTGVL